MNIAEGNGGWVRVTDDQLPLTYVRFGRSESGRWVIVELYLAADHTDPLRPQSVGALPLSDLEAFANSPAVRRRLEARAGSPGVDLRRLASHFATTWGRKAQHWVADSHRAQFPDSGVKQAPMGHRRASVERGGREVPQLHTPREGLTDDFLLQVAEAYDIAVSRGEHPAPAIAAASGVSVSAVRKWVYTARKRHRMAPGQQGRVG